MRSLGTWAFCLAGFPVAVAAQSVDINLPQGIARVTEHKDSRDCAEDESPVTLQLRLGRYHQAEVSAEFHGLVRRTIIERRGGTVTRNHIPATDGEGRPAKAGVSFGLEQAQFPASIKGCLFQNGFRVTDALFDLDAEVAGYKIAVNEDLNSLTDAPDAPVVIGYQVHVFENKASARKVSTYGHHMWVKGTEYEGLPTLGRLIIQIEDLPQRYSALSSVLPDLEGTFSLRGSYLVFDDRQSSTDG